MQFSTLNSTSYRKIIFGVQEQPTYNCNYLSTSSNNNDERTVKDLSDYACMLYATDTRTYIHIHTCLLLLLLLLWFSCGERYSVFVVAAWLARVV